MKKRFVVLALCLIFMISVLGGCTADNVPQKDARLSVVATIFPAYDWARQIIGGESDHVSLTMLLDDGVDLHSFQPTADDIVKISTCDVFIYAGGESDKWVTDALKEATNKDMVVINLLEALGDAAKLEEHVEGMEHGEEGEREYDEHVWLSLKNAAILCPIISEALCGIDAPHKDAYTANTAAYIKKLNALDGAYRAAVESSTNKTVLFGDRFPFRYLFDDYGLRYYAAFAGCSAETEASFETIVFLANKVDDLDLGAIVKIESSDGSIAQTIRENTKTRDQRIVTMDSLQSTTAKDVESGVTYLSAMERNLDALKEALK